MADESSPFGGLVRSSFSFDKLTRAMEAQAAQVDEHLEKQRARAADHVDKLPDLSDDELIASMPAGQVSATNHMELTRRLKNAIEELTGETITARRSSEKASTRVLWLNILLVLLTAALVALTVVLAVKH